MTKYKDKSLNQLYERLVELGSPEELVKAHIFGSVRAAFTNGYNGVKRPSYIVKNTFAWAAYYAGRAAATK